MALGCTVNRATTVRDGVFGYHHVRWFALPPILNLRSTSSVKTARSVRNSVAMGGGGTCAANGTRPPLITAAAMTATVRTSTRFLPVVGFLRESLRATTDREAGSHHPYVVGDLAKRGFLAVEAATV